MATIDSLKEILNENLDIEPEKVVESATFDELGIDSLDMAELICDIEERLDVSSVSPRVWKLLALWWSTSILCSRCCRILCGCVREGHCPWRPLPPSPCRRRRLLSSACKEAAFFDRNARVAKCAK